jgi:O-antigen/teichoic acid export membrane protein
MNSEDCDRSIVDLAPSLNPSRLFRIAKESSWIALGYGVAVIGTLCGIRILSEMMTPSEYGLLALGATLATFSGQSLYGRLFAGAGRFYASAQEAVDLKPFLIGVRRLVLFVSGAIVLMAGAIVVVAGLVEKEYWLPLIIASLIFSIVAGFNAVVTGIQNVARQRAIVALHAGMASWGKFIVAAGLMLSLGVSSSVAMWGYAIAMAIVLGSQYLFFRPIIRSARLEIEAVQNMSDLWQAKILSYAWPFATWGVFSWFQVVSDRWALAMFTSAADVGLFVVLYQLGYYPVALMAEMLVTLVSPIMFQRAGDGVSQQRLANASALTRGVMSGVLVAAATTFLVTLAAHDWIFRVFVAKQYAAVSYLLPWLILSGGIFAAGQVLSIDRMSALDSKGLIAPKVSTAILGGLLNILGAFLYGLEGVVAASLLFSVIYFGWLFLQHLNLAAYPISSLSA